MTATVMTMTATSITKQRGISFYSLLFVFAVVGATGLLGLKVVPHYLDYFTVKKILASIASQPDFNTETVAEIRKSFDRRMTIDYANNLRGEDLEITKDGGQTVITANWTVNTPLFANWVLVINFTATTADDK